MWSTIKNFRRIGMMGLMRVGLMRERSIEDGKGPGTLMVGQMDARDVQTNIPMGH